MEKIRILILTPLFLCFSIFCTFAEIIVLKSGEIVEGKLIEKTDKYIKIDFQGALLTYFLDEIKSIEGIENLPKEDTIQIGNYLVGFKKLPETINNIKVSGKTTCQVQLIQDAMRGILPLFKMTTGEEVSSINFEYLDGKQIGESVVVQEKWIAKSNSFERKYRLEFKNIPGSTYGTDIHIEVLDKK